MNPLAPQLTLGRVPGNKAMALALRCVALHCLRLREGDTRTGFTQADEAPILATDVLL